MLKGEMNRWMNRVGSNTVSIKRVRMKRGRDTHASYYTRGSRNEEKTNVVRARGYLVRLFLFRRERNFVRSFPRLFVNGRRVRQRSSILKRITALIRDFTARRDALNNRSFRERFSFSLERSPEREREREERRCTKIGIYIHIYTRSTQRTQRRIGFFFSSSSSSSSHEWLFRLKSMRTSRGTVVAVRSISNDIQLLRKSYLNKTLCAV